MSSVARVNPPKSLVTTFEFYVSKKQLLLGERWLKSQLDKKYDYAGILLFAGLPRPYKQDDKWICSEYAMIFLTKIKVLKRKPKKLLSPETLYLLLSG